VRIVKIIIYRIRLPFKRPFAHSRSFRRETENIVAESLTDRGVSGFGEGVPRDYVTGETPASAMRYLSQQNYSFLSDECPSLEEGVRRLRAWEIDASRQGEVFPGAARCALGLSLLDALTRSYGVGVNEISRSVEGLLQEERRASRVRYSAVCSGGSVASVVATLLKYRLYNFGSVKVKVGWGERRDLLFARVARRILCRATDIRVDANGAWDTHTAITMIRKLEKYRVSSIEEPLMPRYRVDLPRLRESVRIPIMLDESVCDRDQLTKAIENRSCDMVNIRLSKCGGFFASLQMANILRERGLGYQLGCQVGESGILSAAGRHFAFLVPGIRHIEGSYDRHLLEQNLTEEDPTFGYGGWASPLRGPGLGVTVKRGILDTYTVEKHEIALR